MFDLVTLAKSGLSIHSAVNGGAFEAALSAIALVEMEAARASFSAVRGSADPREALNRTLTHLESAHVALRRSWFHQTVSGHLMPLKRERQANWDARVCCLIAYLHRVLGDANDLVRRALQAAEEARQPSKKEGLTLLDKYAAMTTVPLFIDMPLALVSWLSGGGCPALPDAEFTEFAGLLGFTLQTAGPDAGPGAAPPLKAGDPHPTQPNVVARAAPHGMHWHPAPGYAWVNASQDDMRVQWSPGIRHPDHTNIVAGSKEGTWAPAPGFRWLDESSEDLQVVPR